eukprot:TRINITY_DN126_c0_g1_i1.p1 TRINITY_DN126_c0_g1~~TRINITY_DN126_c0_g1_i1.p1  ORF type:complete len:895 (+),score=160.71 TRINITY_DN126_c0_g1_i1:104-2788(+)
MPAPVHTIHKLLENQRHTVAHLRGVCLLLLLATFAVHSSTAQTLEYGLTLDAGSSGTRVYIYQWAARTNASFPIVVGAPNQVNQTAWSLKISPGISAFPNNLTGLCPYLQPLITYAKSKIPTSQQASTALYLKATAGMRLLSATDAVNVLNAVRDCLHDSSRSPFKFDRSWAKTISGEEEGVYGWVTANILMDTIASNTSQLSWNTWGAFDLGGASTQITFVPDETPLSNYFELNVANRRIPLYTHSYLNYGQDRFFQRFLDALAYANLQATNPCYFNGFSGSESLSNGTSLVFNGTGNYTVCKLAVLDLLDLDAYCPAPPCALLGVHQPDIPVDQRLVFFSAFYYTAAFFGCDGNNVAVNCIENAAKTVCGTSWASAKATYNTTSTSVLKRYCLNAAYITSLLINAYRLSPTRKVSFLLTASNQEVGWALGGMTYEVGAWDPPCTKAAPSAYSPPQLSYGVMLDAGSSGTRAYIYQWTKRVDNTFPDVTGAPNQVNQTAWSLKISPGISAFPNNLTGLCPYLQPLITYAKSKIPTASQPSTVLYLKATAGMRMLASSDVENILDAIRACFSDSSYSPFLFKPEWAKVISGEEEGVFGWVTANLLHNTTGSGSGVLYGALDLGGASTQITFNPAETPYENYFELKLVADRIPLYTHSYLNYGQDRLYTRLLDYVVQAGNQSRNPCLPSNYSGTEATSSGNVMFNGSMNYDICKAYTRAVLLPDTYCSAPPCAVAGVHQPDVPTDLPLDLFSGYYYTASFFNCSGAQKIRCIDDAARSYCQLNWTQMQAANTGTSANFLKKYCLQAALIHVLLTEGYRLNAERTVNFVVTVAGQEIGWALGAMTYEVGAWNVRADNCYGPNSTNSQVASRAFSTAPSQYGIAMILCAIVMLVVGL